MTTYRRVAILKNGKRIETVFLSRLEAEQSAFFMRMLGEQAWVEEC